MPDWATITAWAVGIATVGGSVIGTLWVTINRAMLIAKNTPVPPPPTVQKTDVITTDTVAMERLAGVIDSNTNSHQQLSMLLAEVVTVGKDFTSMMREEREEREFEEEVEKRIAERDEREKERRRHARASNPKPATRRRAPKPQTG